MQSLLELAPLIAFLAAYYFRGLYTATAVLMAAMALLLVVDYVRTRRISTMHALSAALVFTFGAATLLLHNERFIQWKPTVFCWLVSVAFLLSLWIGRQTLAERFLGTAFGEDAKRVPASMWRHLTVAWAVFYAAIGAANLLVAYHLSERAWVYFKVGGITILTLVFVALQIGWISSRTRALAPLSETEAPR